MKKSAAFLLALMMMLSMASCGGSSSAPDQPEASSASASPEAAAPTLKSLPAMELLTASASGSWVPIGAGISEKFNEYYDGFPLTAVPSSGSLANPPLIAAGDGEFGMSYAPFLMAAVEGTGAFEGVEKMENLRAVCALQPTVVHIIADVDPSIKSISDLIDQQYKVDFGVPPTGNASNFLAGSIFRSAGLTGIDDVSAWGGSVYYASGSNLTDAWSNRQVNAYFQTQTVPASGITEAMTGRSGRILDIDGDIAKALIEKEGFTTYTIPANSYPGQTEDVTSVALPIVIFCTDEADEEVVYNICKAIYDNTDYLDVVHSSFKEFNKDNMAVGCGIELHPGAVKFYTEKGLI